MVSITKEFIKESELPLAFNVIADEPIKQFWLERLVQGNLGACQWPNEITGLALYQEYCAYCGEHDHRPKSFESFIATVNQALWPLQIEVAQSDAETSTVRIPPLRSSRRGFLESHPEMVSVIARDRYRPLYRETKSSLLSVSNIFIVTGIFLLIYQLYEFGRLGHWVNYSLYGLAAWLGGDNFYQWINLQNNFLEIKTIFAGLLKFLELSALLIVVGMLIKANKD